MSKKKNKNKNRGVYQNPYQVDDQYLEKVMKRANLSIEDDDPYDYVIDPNHPKAQGASNAPATRSNLKSNASYKDFVNASKEKPVYKPKTPKASFGAMGQPDLRTFLEDTVKGDRSEEETRREVENYTMSDPSMEAYEEEIEEEEVEEYDEDDPYRMDPDIDPEEIDMGLMPGVMPNDDDLFDRVFADEAEEDVEPSAETIQEEIVEEVTAEGIVLTKNEDGMLPMEAGNLNVFGWASTNPVYGGTGSGTIDVSTAVDILSGLESFDAGFLRCS